MKHTKFYILIGIFLLLANISCSTKLAIETTKDSTKKTYCNITPSETLKNTLASLTGNSSQKDFYNTDLLTQSLIEAGFSVENISVTEDGGLSLNINAQQLEIPGCTTGQNSFMFLINPQTMAQIINLVPEETKSYIDLLMAPIITGEEISSSEYVAVIASMYGNTLANELQESKITISFTAPTEIISATIEPKTAQNSIIKKNTANFTLPLSEFLSLFSGVKFSIQWK